MKLTTKEVKPEDLHKPEFRKKYENVWVELSGYINNMELPVAGGNFTEISMVDEDMRGGLRCFVDSQVEMFSPFELP